MSTPADVAIAPAEFEFTIPPVMPPTRATPMTANAREAAAAAAGLLTVTAVLLLAMSFATGAVIGMAEKIKTQVQGLNPANMAQTAMGKVMVMLGQGPAEEVKPDATKGKATVNPDKDDLALGAAIGLLVVAGLFLIQTVLVGLVETFKVLATPAMYGAPEGATDAEIEVYEWVRVSAGLGLAFQTAAHALHLPLALFSTHALRVTGESTAEGAKRAARMHLRLAALLFGCAAGAMTTCAIKMQELPV